MCFGFTRKKGQQNTGFQVISQRLLHKESKVFATVQNAGGAWGADHGLRIESLAHSLGDLTPDQFEAEHAPIVAACKSP